MPQLDIILPCYNPPTGWAENVISSFQQLNENIEADITLILVNDGSTQAIPKSDVEMLTAAIPQFHYVTYDQNRGKGFALRKGTAIAKGDIQIYTDIDFPYTTESVLGLYAQLASGQADIVAGVRDEDYYEHVPGPRRRISKILRWMLRTFLRLKIADTQCGLKGFTQKGRAIFLQTRIDRFLFDLEFIFLASNEDGVKLSPANVQLKPGVEFSRARLGILLRESFNFLWIFLRGLKKRIFGGS